MPHSQPAHARSRAPHATAPDAIPTYIPAPGTTEDNGSGLPTVNVREVGTGPFRQVVVDVQAGVHPASLATVLRTLPIGCEFVDVVDMTGTGLGGELRFRVHDDHDPVWRFGRTSGGTGARVLRLDEDSPFPGDGSVGGVR